MKTRKHMAGRRLLRDASCAIPGRVRPAAFPFPVPEPVKERAPAFRNGSHRRVIF